MAYYLFIFGRLGIWGGFISSSRRKSDNPEIAFYIPLAPRGRWETVSRASYRRRTVGKVFLLGSGRVVLMGEHDTDEKKYMCTCRDGTKIGPIDT